MEFLLGWGEQIPQSVHAEGEESGEETGEVFHCVGGYLFESTGIGYVEKTAVGGHEQEVGDDEVGGSDVWKKEQFGCGGGRRLSQESREERAKRTGIPSLYIRASREKILFQEVLIPAVGQGTHGDLIYRQKDTRRMRRRPNSTSRHAYPPFIGSPLEVFHLVG